MPPFLGDSAAAVPPHIGTANSSAAGNAETDFHLEFFISVLP
jgi:hypothetical protein